LERRDVAVPVAGLQHLTIPATWFRTAPGMPSVCAGHGLPAVRYEEIRVPSWPKVRRGFGGLLADLGEVAEAIRPTRLTVITGWPLCEQCAGTSALRRRLTAVLFFGGLALVGGGLLARLVLGHPTLWLALPMIAGLVTMITSPWVWRAGLAAQISRAVTSEDGQYVLLRKPSPEFAEQLGQLINSSPGYYGASRVYR
jgi:hypothetical protein